MDDKLSSSYSIRAEATLVHISYCTAVLTMRSGLLTSFSNILLTRLRMSNMAASKASGDPFNSGSASVMYL